ncbi:MAG: peptidase C25 [Saprospiraceae bacterium]|nr:MAG: peptidase C25 [Saprospiraceae bacterium]
MKKIIFTLVLGILFSPFLVFSQYTIQQNFTWENTTNSFRADINETYDIHRFEGGIMSAEFPGLPYLSKKIDLNGPGRLEVEILDAQFEPLDHQPSSSDEGLSERLNFNTSVHRDRNNYYGKVFFIPIIKRGNEYQRLTSIRLRVNLIPEAITSSRGPDNTEVSVLSDGSIYKIATSTYGIHKLTYSFLKNDLGMDLDNIDPRTIKLYGNGGGMLPVYSEAERYDDLIENHIHIEGESDGSFDQNDYLLFYGQGPDNWEFDAENGIFDMHKNIYDTRAYYFIKVSPGNGARLQTQNSISNTAHTATGFNDYARVEQDKVNLMHEWEKAEGSGQSWFGDYFKVAREYSYTELFSFPNLLPQAPAHLSARMNLRAAINSKFYIDVQGTTVESSNANKILTLSGSNDNTIDYSQPAKLNETISLTNGKIDLKVRYPQPNTSQPSEGWLDYIQFNVRRALTMSGSQMTFSDLESLNYPSTTFNLANATNNLRIWDISNTLQPKLQNANFNNNQLSFGVNTGSLKTFVVFNPNDALKSAEAIGPIGNQNIHGANNVDMVVIYHPDFQEQVQDYVQHRSSHSNISILAVSIDQVFNEFSSGAQDATAIRDFARMLYDRTDQFKSLLLFGDASFDFREIYGLGNNKVISYQRDSTNPLYAFPTDDYYGLLYNSNENDPLKGDLQIAIGRFPVNTPEEASGFVNKLKNYDANPATMRDWRNRLLFVGDDEDGSQHSKDANGIAEEISAAFPFLNVDKIYLDAFPQVSTPAGDRFPSVTESINRSIFKGILGIVYLGHGGPKGWAQERILNISDITNWENPLEMPLFVTATCSFTAFDDPSFVSAGEEVFLNPKGGAIALLTTTRAVYANQNEAFTNLTLLQLFNKDSGAILPLGQSMRIGKNQIDDAFTELNSRKFVIIGDPSMRLAIPEYEVETTKVNVNDVTIGVSDTLRALEKVTIEGQVIDEQGQLLSNFNGIVYPTIFDKATTVTTLGQDNSSPVFSFKIQKNIIFKGRASVTNGRFSFTFVMPKDINYEYGKGKISYYAADTDQMKDASGLYDNIIIGSISPEGLADDQGPDVNVYMNTFDFIFGGVTDDSPTLLVKLEDDFGINVVGNSIGHDLEGVLDDNTQNTLLLNDFYESALDDYTKGEVRYPLSTLSEGLHTMRVKAWDVANNSSEGYTEFVVAPNAQVALNHVLNYPNPFTDFTCFQFDHNLAGQQIDVLIQIFTVSGRLVKTLDASIFTDGALRLDDCIEWDGKDDYGDQLARGVYLYKVRVRANAGETALKGESGFEKLVILK